MGVRLLFIGAVISVLMGCGGPKTDVPVELNNDRWTVGDTLWLRVVSTDSAFGADSVMEGRQKEKRVRLVVLDTGTSGRIEWQEFGVMTIEEDTTLQPGPGYLFASTRIVYDCHSDGSINRIMNWSELRGRADTLLKTYLSQIDPLPAEAKEKLLAWAMDSMTFSDHILSDAELFHLPFGFTLTDSMQVDGEVDLLDPAISPVHVWIERTNNALCDPNTHVALHGRIEADTVDFGRFAAGIDLLVPFWDSTRTAREPVEVSFDVCFDTSSGMPAYVEQIIRSNLWGIQFQRTAHIYRDQRIAH